MPYVRFAGTFKSAAGNAGTGYYIYTPETDVTAVLQIIHDWGEEIRDYRQVIHYLTDHGIAVCGCDLTGHGASAEGAKGSFAAHNGWSCLVKDQKKLFRIARKTFPGAPCYVYGQGLGALIARLFCIKNEDVDGLILGGVPGIQRFNHTIVLGTGLIKRIKSPSFQIRKMTDMVTGNLNRGFPEEEGIHAWYSENPEARKKYEQKKPSRIPFSVSVVEDMLKMVSLCQVRTCCRNIKEGLPVFLAGGSADPVCRKGRELQHAARCYEQAGHPAEVKIYEGVRHSLKDSFIWNEVFEDMLQWIRRNIPDEEEDDIGPAPEA